jgi:hypothetical protein
MRRSPRLFRLFPIWALGGACSETHPQSSEPVDAPMAAEASMEEPGDELSPPAVIPDGEGAVPTCSNGMGQPAQVFAGAMVRNAPWSQD